VTARLATWLTAYAATWAVFSAYATWTVTR
jgi:hypothetical protein